jgi:hypothetical protein
LLNIDADLVDSTITSADEVREKMEQFIELLRQISRPDKISNTEKVYYSKVLTCKSSDQSRE